MCPCVQGAEGPLKLKGNGEGLDEMLSWDSFSKWPFPSPPHPPRKNNNKQTKQNPDGSENEEV